MATKIAPATYKKITVAHIHISRSSLMLAVRGGNVGDEHQDAVGDSSRDNGKGDS